MADSLAFICRKCEKHIMQASELKKSILKSDQQFRSLLKSDHYIFHENLRELKATQAVFEATRELPDLDFEDDDSTKSSVPSKNIRESEIEAEKSDETKKPPSQMSSSDPANVKATMEQEKKKAMKEKVLETLAVVNNNIRSIKKSESNQVVDPKPDKMPAVEQESNEIMKEKVFETLAVVNNIHSIKNPEKNPIVDTQTEQELSVEESLKILNTYELEDFWKDADTMLVEALEEFDSLGSSSEVDQISVPVTKCVSSPKRPFKKTNHQKSWTHIKKQTKIAMKIQQSMMKTRAKSKESLPMKATKMPVVSTRNSLKAISTAEPKILLATSTLSASNSLDKTQKRSKTVITRQLFHAEATSKPLESIPASRKLKPDQVVETSKALEPLSTLTTTAHESLEPMFNFAARKPQTRTTSAANKNQATSSKSIPANGTRSMKSVSPKIAMKSSEPTTSIAIKSSNGIRSTAVPNLLKTNLTSGNEESKIVPIAVSRQISNPISMTVEKPMNFNLSEPPAAVVPPFKLSHTIFPSSFDLASIIEISSDEEPEKTTSKQAENFDPIKCLTSEQIMEMTNMIDEILPGQVVKDKTMPKSNKRKRNKKEKRIKKIKIDIKASKVIAVPTSTPHPMRPRRESILIMPKFRIVKMIKPHDNL